MNIAFIFVIAGLLVEQLLICFKLPLLKRVFQFYLGIMLDAPQASSWNYTALANCQTGNKNAIGWKNLLAKPTHLNCNLSTLRFGTDDRKSYKLYMASSYQLFSSKKNFIYQTFHLVRMVYIMEIAQVHQKCILLLTSNSYDLCGSILENRIE